MLYSLVQIGRRLRGAINELVERFSDKNPDVVQGVILKYDSYWVQYVRQIMSTHVPRCPWPPFHPKEFIEFQRHSAREVERIIENIDEIVPPFWGEYCHANGLGEGAGPVIVLLILRNPRDIDRMNDLGVQLPNGAQVRAEVRPPCRAYAPMAVAKKGKRAAMRVGVAGNPATEGTLGGLLRDQSRRSFGYLVSCAHVLGDSAGTAVESPGPGGRHSHGRRIATVSFGVMPPPISSGIRCNDKASPEISIDAAIAELDPGVSIAGSAHPAVSGVRPIKLMGQGDPVWFNGARSGLVRAELGGLCLWYEVEVQKQRHCFGNIFEIKPRRPWYVNTNLARPGDSGAWIVSDDGQLHEWSGMLIGGDGATVYCSFAERIIDELRKGTARHLIV